ncbi:MAG: hypothetical protein WEA31_07180 [Pirellulales bacterium]
MNYFAHACDFLDDPYFVAGVSIPDWMNVVDRRHKVRGKHAKPWVVANAECGMRSAEDSQSEIRKQQSAIARIAAGVVQHHHDDAWFHETRAFAELSMQFAAAIRECLPECDSWRTGFLGHILVELLLDAELIARDPARLDAYYASLDHVDPAIVADAVQRISGRAAPRLAELIPKFIEAKFLCDYADDEKLLKRLNQVMTRVKLATLPPEFSQVLPTARREVSRRWRELLAQRRRSGTREEFHYGKV